MQKYKSNITTTSGAAVRNVPVHVLAEDGSPAAIFLDRAGTVSASNPLITAADGTFYFYAVNGRYSLRTTVDGVTITDDDVVLMMDPAEITVAGPIAEAVAAAQAAATAAETAVADSGIPVLVSSAQNAVVDANAALDQAIASSNSAALSKTDADAARDASVAAKNAASATLAEIHNHYYGPLASDPVTRPDGSAVQVGDEYQNTTTHVRMVYADGAWRDVSAAAISLRTDRSILSYPDYTTATAAAATLPDGQLLHVADTGVEYTAQSGVLATKTGFWADVLPGGAQIFKSVGRHFYGDGAKNTGRKTAPLGGSWLTKYGANYFEKNSYNIMLSEEDQGKCPLLVGCYTGPSETVSNYNMGFGAVTVNRGQGTMGRAAYLEAMHFGSANQTLGMEIQVGNYSDASRSANPYEGQGNADGLMLSVEAGYGYVTGDENTPVPDPTGPAGTAIFMKGASGSGAFRRWRQGILFGQYSLYRGSDGLTGNALAIGMAQGHEVSWFASSALVGAKLRSDVTAVAGDGVGIIFKNSSVQIVGNAESPLASFTHDKVGAGGVNYVDLKNARANVFPQLTATGSDTNIGIDFRSKGTGVLRFFTRGGASEELRIQNVVANAVNFVAISGQATNAAPRVTVLGADANIDLELAGKGTGVIKFGYNSTAATTPASFTADRCIQIKDASGTTYYIPARSSAW